MNLKPVQDRVFIKRDVEENVTSYGFVVPDSPNEKPATGVIVAVGDGKFGNTGIIRPLSVKVGDKVMFSKVSGQNVKVDGEEFVTMREEEIIAVVLES